MVIQNFTNRTKVFKHFRLIKAHLIYVKICKYSSVGSFQSPESCLVFDHVALSHVGYILSKILWTSDAE